MVPTNFLYYSTVVNTSPSLQHHTHKLRIFKMSSLDDRLLLVLVSIDSNKEDTDEKMKQFDYKLKKSLHLSNICCFRIKFPPQAIMLKMMDFLKSPSQHPKSILPSLTHQVLEPQHK